MRVFAETRKWMQKSAQTRAQKGAQNFSDQKLQTTRFETTRFGNSQNEHHQEIFARFRRRAEHSFGQDGFKHWAQRVFCPQHQPVICVRERARRVFFRRPYRVCQEIHWGFSSLDGPIRANRIADSRESPDSRESSRGSPELNPFFANRTSGG